VRTDHVFLNCPFDEDYLPVLRAIVFAVQASGFEVRSALEEDNSAEERFCRICDIIADCRLGIHDLSRVQQDPTTGAPRFNMPLELGLFLGARQFGCGDQKTKQCLVLDAESFRYRNSCSDIAGRDIKVHGNKPQEAIKQIRNWLNTINNTATLPGANYLTQEYERFLRDLPVLCESRQLAEDDLTYLDFLNMAKCWIAERKKNLGETAK